jgi:hypothetical protein
LPPADEARQASALRTFEAFIDELAGRVEGEDPAPTSDPSIAKV